MSPIEKDDVDDDSEYLVMPSPNDKDANVTANLIGQLDGLAGEMEEDIAEGCRLFDDKKYYPDRWWS